MKKKKRIFRILAGLLFSPVVLFLLAALLIYFPPVQRLVVNRVAAGLSESMEMDVRVKGVRLAFPLDLAVQGVTAIEGADTLLDLRALRLDVELLPLFRGQVNVDGFGVYGLKMDTKSYISDTRLRGTVGELTATVRPADLKKETVNVNRVRLKNADIAVALSDTAAKDTTQSETRWCVSVARADITDSRIRLSMPGDSMRIGATLGNAALRSGTFDIGRNFYAVRSLALTRSAVNYDIPSAAPVRGIDPNHISLTGVSLQLDTLSYNAAGELRAGLRHLAFHERCGLDVDRARASVLMDSVSLRLPQFSLVTPYSQVDAEVGFDFRSMTEGRGGHCRARLDAALGREDLRILAAGYADGRLLRMLPAAPLKVHARVGGNIGHLLVDEVRVALPGVVELSAGGNASNVLHDWRSGRFDFRLQGRKLGVVRALLPAGLRQSVNVPDGIGARGSVTFRGDAYGADVRLTQGGGSLQAKGQVNLRSETYRLAASARNFPVARFAVGVPVGPFSGTIRAGGVGFDPTSRRATLTADAAASRLTYDKYDLSGLKIGARLRHGRAQADFMTGRNPLGRLKGSLDALIGTRGYDVRLLADVEELDLRLLGLTKDSLWFGSHFDVKAKADKTFTDLALDCGILRNCFITPRMSTMAKDIYLSFATSRRQTSASVAAGDLSLRLLSAGDIPHLGARLTRFAKEAAQQVGRRSLDQEKLKTLLPEMSLYLCAGRDNPIYNILRMKGYSFNSVYLNLNTDPAVGMTGDTRLGQLSAGKMLIDTVYTRILQDSTGVQMQGFVKNGKRNPVPLEVQLRAHLLKAGAGVELVYLDADGEKGVDIGVRSEMTEKGAYVHLYPEHPVLAYRNFTVNRRNYIFFGSDKTIRADVDLLADDGTGLKIYGEPADSLNDLTVSVKQLNLGELSDVLPYLPALEGMLSGDVHLTASTSMSDLSAVADIKADGFKFDGTSLGDIGVEAVYLPKAGDEHHASAFISANGEEVVACNGTYVDRDGGTFSGEARLLDFPLAMLNGFLSGTDVALKGRAGGELNIAGTLDNPVINGALDLDSAHVYSDVYGFDLRTDERAVKIEGSRLVFDDYNLYSTGKQPLVLNGAVDMSDFSRMTLDFNMKARDFELINTRKKAQSMVFGKVYVNFLATMKGTPDDLSVRGSLELLDRTDVTYILKDSPLSVDNRLDDLVQFVSFNDTTAVAPARPAAEGGFDMTMGISVSDAARFHCDLSEDGQSYVDLEGGGDMTLRMTRQGEMRMTGRFTVNSGEMKYSLPVIPLKTFKLQQGSYVEFTGDVENPTLNIIAKERTKATVTEDDKQRSVAFDVGVAITRPLSDMGLEFTIEAPEDLAVQNELAAMSAEQRGKAAVTMMATGMYMTDETMMKGSGFKANNALNAFLQSEIQQIAGSALRTVDINLGVESGTAETGTSTTDYSFQFAKRFWGNRISVIIGGKVSTGADAKNSAESFISNVSVEYRLDKSATRYVKVFYDRDSQDPLEGQLTKTGAGLVLKRKTDRLGELFIFRKKKKDPVAL